MTNEEKKNTLANLTDLEKQVIITMFDDGFAFDDLNENFMTWGVDGKRERGALASLVKKGVVTVEDWGRNAEGYRETPVFVAEGFTKRDLLDAVEYED